MRATPAGEVGMALPAACVALLARDARAPLSRFSHIASIAFSQCARSGFESSATLDGQGAGDLAMAHTGWQGWCHIQFTCSPSPILMPMHIHRSRF